MRFAAILLVLIALGVAIAAGLRWEAENFAAPGPSQADTIVLVKAGTGLKAVAEQLAKTGIVSSAELFRWGVVRRGKSSDLKAGEYIIPAGASMDDILGILAEGKSMMYRLTIAEGLTSEMAAAIVNADIVLTGDAGATPPEGSLLPETYLFERGTTRAQILARMRKAQEDVLAALWPARRPGLPYNSVQDALILASIVEKETAIPAERGRIAAVFINRLRKGMRLESDPTIIYGLTRGQPLGHELRQSELDKRNPYSTYQIDGLPPTPICNPGRDAIAAVLDPPDTDELYFVADGTGGHVFARTMAEHEKNVVRWRRSERRQQQVQPQPLHKTH